MPPGRPTGKGLKFWSTRWLWPWSRKECRTTTSMPWLASKPSVFSHLGMEGAESGHGGGTPRPRRHSHAPAHGTAFVHLTWRLLPAPELKPSGAPAAPILHVPTPCLSPCVHPSVAALRPKPGVPPQPASTLHPPSEPWGPEHCSSLSPHTPQAKSSPPTACHSPDPGMSLLLPAQPR